MHFGDLYLAQGSIVFVRDVGILEIAMDSKLKFLQTGFRAAFDCRDEIMRWTSVLSVGGILRNSGCMVYLVY